jgi:hypothetical protein
MAAVGAYVVHGSFAAGPNKPSPTPSVGPLASAVTQNWSNDPAHYIQNYGCFGVDDQALWNGTGTLAPGETYTFTPTYPACAASEEPIIAMHVDWTGSTTLKLETTTPFEQAYIMKKAVVGKHFVAPVTTAPGGASQANLCLLTNPGQTDYDAGYTDINTAPHIPWTMTVTNTGTQTATVNLSGVQKDGWPSYFYPYCMRADTDNDHWNDSLEMVINGLTYISTGDQNHELYFDGSDSLSGLGTATPLDEVDASPVDFNDDGIVDQTDVNAVLAYIGQGSGVPFDEISPNPGDSNSAANQARTWRRYDIDGDGYVTQHDVSQVQTLVGKPMPLDADYLDPWAVITTPSTVPANYKGYYLYAFASDNDMLTHVDIYAAGKLLCSTWGGYETASRTPQFGCTWAQTPRKSGTPTVITVKAYDAAGHYYTTSKTVTTQ